MSSPGQRQAAFLEHRPGRKCGRVLPDAVADIATFETMRERHGNGANVTVVKEAMALLGFRMGPVRLPGLPVLNAAERAELRGAMAGWGVLPGAVAAE
ncbi:hypothetical protein [Phreatobacter sp.]|uniref:hypothetical protein n=1 Tax=Phreatobacter sp. TaxID=1966341 RepID=UPI003F6FC1D3